MSYGQCADCHTDLGPSEYNAAPYSGGRCFVCLKKALDALTTLKTENPELRAELEMVAQEASKWHRVLRDGFRFTEGKDGPERVAYYWCVQGGGPPNGWSVRDGMLAELQRQNAELRAQVQQMKETA